MSAGNGGWNVVGPGRLAEIVARVAGERRPERLGPAVLDAALAATGARGGRVTAGGRTVAWEGDPADAGDRLRADLPGAEGAVGAVEVWSGPGDPGDPAAAQALLDLVATVGGRAFDAVLAERAHAAALGRSRRLEAAAAAVREAADARDAVARVLAEARALVDAPAAALLAAGAPSPEVAAYDGLDPLSPDELALLVGPSMAARLAAGLAWSGPLPAGSALRRRGLRTGGLVAVGPDASLGVLGAFWERPDAGTEDDLAALAALAGHAASALTATVLRQEVRELGVVDPLTRFFNERYFHARLEQECQRALRAGTPVSIAIMTLDGMARARAAGRGHQAEAAIEALAAHVTERLRGMDVGCRVGEDELAAILPEVEGLDALRVGERLRMSVAAAPGLGEGVTLSVGVACFPAQAGRSDTLVAHARSALAWAQEHGGDRTFLYSAETAEILRAEHDEDVVDDESVMATLVALAAGVDARHPATAHHHENVARVAALIAAELGMPTDVVEDIRVAGLVHDVGKIGMADDVIAADDDGDGEAAEELRRHPEIGERMLTGSRLENVAPWIRHHHERVDGAGYPDGLAGEHIPVESRILAVADAWDNLRSGRWGGVRRAPADVMRELERRSGAHLDPVAVAALRALVGRGAAEAPRVP